MGCSIFLSISSPKSESADRIPIRGGVQLQACVIRGASLHWYTDFCRYRRTKDEDREAQIRLQQSSARMLDLQAEAARVTADAARQLAQVSASQTFTIVVQFYFFDNFHCSPVI